MDAEAREMMRAKAYGQAVWSWHPDAGAKPTDNESEGDGG